MKPTNKKIKPALVKNSPLVQEIERLESELLKTKQEEERLKAENQKIKLHNGLIEIITKFQKNAQHYQMVRCNEITEKIEKHPGLPDKFKDWTNSDLAKRAAEYGKGDTSTIEEADNFAVETTQREMEARGRLWADIGKDPIFAGLVVQRLGEYRDAYLRRHILFLKKECADVEHPDSEMAAAASAGLALANGDSDTPEVKKWLEKITGEEQSIRNVPHLWSKDAKDKSENLARCFRRALAGQQKAKWKQPALDSWLLLVWPLVEAEEWNYATVHYLANLKFPSFDGKPMRSADAMGAHCKITLGLKIKNPKSGRPDNNQFDLEKPSALHRFATQIGDSFPDFSSFPKIGK